jgi:glucosamine-6-phosphate deaminase
MRVSVLASGRAVGEAAAAHTAGILVEAVRARGGARVIIATGNSQLPFAEALRARAEIPWDRITAFHMDEYAGMTDAHPASFRRWIRERIEEPLRPRAVQYLAGDAPDLEAECRRYEALLREAPIDLVCMGIGENGHIAFNDPPVADFHDPAWVKAVELDDACRGQQVGEGHFATLTDVPTHALTLTVPALIAPRSLQVVVPERRKAGAVRKTIEGPIDTSCPASILRRQPHATLFLDAESASLLSRSS